ncbi:hypothetical protein PR048_017888 [Dryococelus australis]|uniref:DDE Tnp4 domain-containing protein n=1 Tax=Dryococelus australis TaxID=614101 RepID=A0ABQ9HAW3_9NEOP|nr:hypothetical protein PR048_017888 [Dryococelus australis]
MAACDARYKFLWVDVGCIGYLPNTNVVAPFWFIADEAFSLKQHILHLYSGCNLNDSKRIFNYRLLRAHRTIENSFGILVARWRIFQSKLPGVPTTAESYILAAVTQHNFIMALCQPEPSRYCPENFVDHEKNGMLVPGEWRNNVGRLPHTDLGRLKSNNPAKMSEIMRNTVADFLIKEGRVHVAV